MTDDRMVRHLLAVRRLRQNWWKYRPRYLLGPPDPVLMQTMIDDGLLEVDDADWFKAHPEVSREIEDWGGGS